MIDQEMNMTNINPSATFLGLPPELRQAIYLYTISADVDFQEHECKNDASTFHPNWTCLSLRIPWLRLGRTCKLIAGELQLLTSGKSFAQNGANHTWEIDAAVERGASVRNQYTIAKRRIERLRLPCHPKAVKHVVFNVELSYDHKDGGLDCNTLEAVMRDLWTPLRGSGSPTDMSVGLLPRPDSQRLTFDVLDKGVGEADARTRDIMTLQKEVFEFWFSANYGVGETHVNIVELEEEVMSK